MTSGCPECGAPLAADQRYCLHCGARHGAPRLDPLAALGFAETAPPALPPAPPARGPSRRLAVGLAVATLVLGGLVGAALGPGPTPSVAATPQRIVALVLPATAPATPQADADPAPPAVDETPSAPAAPDPATEASATADAGAAADAPAATGTGDDAGATDDTGTTDGDAPAATTPAPAATTPAPAATTPAPAATPHVWVVSLTGLDAATAFGPASPLADLVAQGALLRGYAPVAPSAAANGLALLGGQVPAADCAADLAACVLPASEPSLPGQVAGAGQAWKAYIEDPAARAAGPVARVPVSLFAGLTDVPGHTAGTEALAADLATAATTPELSLVVPAAPGLDAAPAVHDAVARITASPAYRAGGVLLVLVDAPPPSGDPVAPLPAVGALVLSPRASPGRTLDTPTGPAALLHSLDDLLGLPALGAAAQAPAGALDDVLAPPVATASAASVFSHPRSSTTTRRSS